MTLFRRFGFLILVNFLILITLGFIWSLVESYFGLSYGNTTGLFVFCAILGMGGAFISLYLSKFMAKKLMGVRIIDKNVGNSALRQVVEDVHRLARQAGLTVMPEVGVYESANVNAFATGPSRNSSLVAVSTGLLRTLDSKETEGVLAHEVAHIVNGDMVTMTLLQGVINTFVYFFARLIANVLVRGDNNSGFRGFFAYMAIVMVLQIVLGILGSTVVMFYSRWREYRADYGGAKLAGKEKMVAALQALERQVLQKEKQSESMAVLQISGDTLKSIFSTHPPLSQRIRRLQKARNLI